MRTLRPGAPSRVLDGDSVALADKDLLEVARRRRPEPLSPRQYVIEHEYTLQAPFSQDWRARPTPLATVTAIHGAA